MKSVIWQQKISCP